MLQAARQGGAGVLGTFAHSLAAARPAGGDPLPVRPPHEQPRAARQGVVDHPGPRCPSHAPFTSAHPVPRSRFPDDERLDIVQTTYSPGVRRSWPERVANPQFAQAAQDLLCYAGLPIEPREIERVAEDVGRASRAVALGATGAGPASGRPSAPARSWSLAQVLSQLRRHRYPHAPQPNWWDEPANKPMARPAPAKPNWAASSPRVGLDKEGYARNGPGFDHLCRRH